MITKSLLLRQLPPFSNNSVLIEKNQSVHDIIKEVCNAHRIFASHYDSIAFYFDRPTIRETAQALFDFLKQNIKYKIEPESRQTTKSPAGIIATGNSSGGDCKHFAGFIAGVLDALNRAGKNITWYYRFASYNMFDKNPGHVFVVVKLNNGRELWIDPVLSSLDQRLMPAHTPTDKNVSSMPLERISGLERLSGVNDNMPAVPMDEKDLSLDPALLSAIRLLLFYKIMDSQGRVSQSRIDNLAKTVSSSEIAKIADALTMIKQNVIGGFFDQIWQGIKTVGLAIPRSAYLELIMLNFNHWATSMYNIIYDSNNKMRPEAADLRSKWESLGGNWQSLVVNVVLGSKIKAILGAVQTAAWVASATAIIAAMTPIISQLITKIAASKSKLALPTNPLPNVPVTGGSTTTAVNWIKNNPAILAVAAAGGYYLLTQKKKRKSA